MNLWCSYTCMCIYIGRDTHQNYDIIFQSFYHLFTSLLFIKNLISATFFVMRFSSIICCQFTASCDSNAFSHACCIVLQLVQGFGTCAAEVLKCTCTSVTCVWTVNISSNKQMWRPLNHSLYCLSLRRRGSIGMAGNGSGSPPFDECLLICGWYVCLAGGPSPHTLSTRGVPRAGPWWALVRPSAGLSVSLAFQSARPQTACTYVL